VTLPVTIVAEIGKLNPSAQVTLFVLDATAQGVPSPFYFHAGTNELSTSVFWQGQEYSPMPIMASGFELSSSGSLPRPKLVVANVGGLVTSLILQYGDLSGAKVTRKRTLVKFLDAANFVGGVNATADPNAYFADEVWFIDRKEQENRVQVSFELAAAWDVQGLMLPRRQVIQNLCTWGYRSAECGYAGGAVATITDVATGDTALDRCGKRLSSCKLRFGLYAELPYGGFPGANLQR